MQNAFAMLMIIKIGDWERDLRAASLQQSWPYSPRPEAAATKCRPI